MVEKDTRNVLNLAGVKPATWARVILFVVAIVNRILLSRGMNVLNIDEATATVIADGFVAIMGVVCAWKNNSFTSHAIQADEIMAEMKNPIMDEYIDMNDIEDIEAPSDIEE